MRRPLILALHCLMMTSALTGLAAQPARYTEAVTFVAPRELPKPIAMS